MKRGFAAVYENKSKTIMEDPARRNRYGNRNKR